MLALNRGRDFYGVVGQPTGTFCGETEICVGDDVEVAPEPGRHNSTGGVVAVFCNKFAVMGIAGTPISKIQIVGIRKSHTDIEAGEYVGPDKDFVVVKWEN